MFNTELFINEVKQYAENIYNAFDASNCTKEAFNKIDKKISIDYGIMENAQNVAVIPADFSWSDLGTWSSVKQWLENDENENSVTGNHLGIDTSNSLFFGSDRLIATVGVSGLIVIDTEDALLICRMDKDQRVREIVKLLERKESKFPE